MKLEDLHRKLERERSKLESERALSRYYRESLPRRVRSSFEAGGGWPGESRRRAIKFKGTDYSDFVRMYEEAYDDVERGKVIERLRGSLRMHGNSLPEQNRGIQEILFSGRGEDLYGD